MFLKRLLATRTAIPDGWSVRLLDHLAKRGSGHTPDRKEPTYYGGPIKWISLKDSDKLDKIYISNTEDTITEAGIANSSAVLHPAGIVVLSRDAGVGKSAITTCEMAVSQHFVVWKCGPDLSNVFLYYWLQFMKPEFERIAVGSTIKTIGLPYFRKLDILRPPLREQEKIAAILLAWDRAIGLTERLIAAKRELKQALMQRLLTGKVRFPESTGQEWQKLPLGDLVRDTHRPVVWDDAALYKLASIRRHSQGMFYREPTYGHQIKVKKLFVVKENDFLISNIQAAYGAMGMVPAEFDGAFISDQYTVLTFIDPTRFDIRFLGFVSELPWFRHQIRMASNGFFAERLRLLFDVDSLLKRKLAVPPTFSEQHKIATVLSAANSELAMLNRKLDALRRQKKGLMQQLLTGKVRVSRPVEPPGE